jgi:zinc protease
VPAVEPVRLPGGVAVYVVEDRTLPLVDVTVAVRAGDWLDPADKVGLASLTGLQVRRGGSAAQGPDEIDQEVDFLGAAIDSVGGSTRSGATLNCASHVFPQALELFFSLLETPRFDEGRLALARANLGESLSRRNDSPLDVLEREWRFLLFGPEHYTARKLLPRHLAAITRKDLAAFHRRFWVPQGMVIAVSGDVDKAAVVDRLTRLLADWPSPGEKAPWPPPASKLVPRPGLYHLEHDTPQAKIALGHLGAERKSWSDAEPFALQVMNEILGGSGTLSRLGSRLRFELGLVYRASSSFGVGLGAPGEFQVFLETDNANAGRVVSVALDEIRRLREVPVGVAELAVAKKSLVDSFPLLFDSAAKVAGRLAEDEYLGRPHTYWDTWRRQIEGVTAAAVQRAAQQHLRPDQTVVLTVGRWQDVAAGAKRDGVSLERLAGGAATRLPGRNPLTLDTR